LVRRQVILFASGGLWLVVGAAFYAIVRPPAALRTILPGPFAFAEPPTAAGPLLGSAPTFVHAVAFSLLTAAALRGSARRFVICGGWAAIEIAFELLQHPRVGPWLLANAPLSSMPFMRAYLTGTFDPADVLAALLGSAAAFCVLTLLHRTPR
jgi:hypothetical protein